MRLTLGIDVACRADHVASLADEDGRLLWQGRRFRTTVAELTELVEGLGTGEDLTVVLEPTRNAWVPIAAHFLATGARVVVVPPERSADLRRYYSKHTKNDGLDSKMLARLPLLHPDGLTVISDLGPAEVLKRAVRRRVALVRQRTGAHQRVACLLEMLGQSYGEAFGTGDYSRAALAVLGRYADPQALRRLGRARLTELLRKASRGQWGAAKATQMLAAASEACSLWKGGGLDLEELSWDVASEVRVAHALDGEIVLLDRRIGELYAAADPTGIVTSAPGVAATLGPGILGRLGDARRFHSLAGVRSFSGMIPGTSQSGEAQGSPSLTKAGDPGLRRDLFLAADGARLVDPQLAARYHRLMTERGKTHTSAVCHVATALLTRIAACWRSGERYVIRDVDGRPITPAEGRAIVSARYRIPAEVREARRRTRKAQVLKGRTARRKKESTEAAPALGPSEAKPTEEVLAS